MKIRNAFLPVALCLCAAAPSFAQVSALPDEAVHKFFNREEHSLASYFARPLAEGRTGDLRLVLAQMAGETSSELGASMEPKDLAAASAEAKALAGASGAGAYNVANVARALRQDNRLRASAERAAGVMGAGGVSFDQAKSGDLSRAFESKVSVVFLGGAAKTGGENGKTLGTGGVYAHIASPDRDKKGSFGADLGVIYSGAGQRTQHLHGETLYGGYYRGGDYYAINRNVYREVTGSNIVEFAGGNYETRKFGPVSLEAGARALYYLDDPRAKVVAVTTERSERWTTCYDSAGYSIPGGCTVTDIRELDRETLQTGQGVKASGMGGTLYGAVNVRVGKHFDVRVEGAKTKAGVLSSNGVRVGGRVGW